MNCRTQSSLRSIVAFVFLPICNITVADSIEVVWRGSPIQLEMSVGSERAVTVLEAESISVDIPSHLTYQLDMQVIGNQLWLTPREQFSKTRIVVLARPLGRLIFEVSASVREAPSLPLTVRFPPSAQNYSAATIEQPRHGFATLTRWAAQQMYAPKRLLKPLSGIVKIPVKSEPLELFRCANRHPTLCANGVIAIPIASWRSPDYYITAVKISNNLDEHVTLDPREIIGAWRTASFLHARLSPKGDSLDSTVVVLISDFPFRDAAI